MRPAKAAENSPSSTLGLALVPSASEGTEHTHGATAHQQPQERTDDWIKVRELALRHLNRFVSLEPKVLKGEDPEAVHDLRVSSRRLQQLLDLLYPEPPKEIRRVLRSVKTARRALSNVRNDDVHLARVHRSLARRTSRREAWESVRDYLVERRAGNWERAQRKLSKTNLAAAYVRLRDHLDWGAAPRNNGHVQAPRALVLPDEFASHPFQERFRVALERVWRDYESQITESQRDREAPALHGARIATKRLRYLVEVLGALEIAGSDEVLSWLRGLQVHLGGWHDLEVFDQVLLEMVARPKFLRDHLETAMAVEKLIVRNRKAKTRFVEKYFAMTQDSVGSQRLKGWIESRVAESSGEPAQV